MLVVSVQGGFEEARRQVREARGELIELRLDLLEKSDLAHVSKLKSESKLPVIFTLKKKGEEEKLLELLSLKPDYVDLDYTCEFADRIDPAIQIIASYHDFEKTPEDLEGILKQMDRFPSAIKKIATMANSSIDALRMLNFVKRHGVAGMCMGEKGKVTRILGPVVDAPLVYASIGEETAPGQLSVSELMEVYHFDKLNRQTKVYGLIGDPIDKSPGHLFHNEAFRHLKEDAVYVKLPLAPAEVDSFFREIQTLPFFGFSVTMPLKERVAPHLSTVDVKARKIGAINTLAKRKGEWFGMNTDGEGALDALEKKGKVKGKVVVIIGAGGTAKAIAHEVAGRGGKVIIANRTLKKGEILAHAVGGMAAPLDAIPDYDILIHATPETQKLPIPEKDIQSKKVVFDVALGETLLLNLAQNKGCIPVFGREMYREQAIRQLEVWLNRSFSLPLQSSV